MKTCSKCSGLVEAKYEKYGRICRACRTRICTERNRKDQSKQRAAGARYRATSPNYPKQRRVHGWRSQGIKITLAEYEALLAKQGGRCAICRTNATGAQSFHVDHDHDFKHVRGLLCAKCNRSLGGFRDSPTLLRSAARYLDQHTPRLALTHEGAAR